MHLEVYRQRPDVQAVVHAHPPIATGFAVAGIPLDRAVLAEVVTTLGSVPIAEYATPSTTELPEAVRKYVKAHDGMLLANHGALTLGADLFAAYYKMETIEHFANISLVARMLGGERLLSREEVVRLQGLRGRTASRRRRRSAPNPRRRRRVPVGLPGGAGALIASGERRGSALPAGRPDEEIRLTYRELTALIEDAVEKLEIVAASFQLPAASSRALSCERLRGSWQLGSWQLEHGGMTWVRRSAWSRPRGSSR